MATIQVDSKLAAFLDLIAWAEGTSTDPCTKADGYDIIAAGINAARVFTDYSTHPFAHGREPIVTCPPLYKGPYGPTENLTAARGPVVVIAPELTSTGSGRYSITWPTWQNIAPKISVHTFSPHAQDLAAVQLILECAAMQKIMEGQLVIAFQLVSYTWASFPAGLFNNKARTTEQLLNQYARLSGAPPR
jgi:muramidase (phage lysozyme)